MTLMRSHILATPRADSVSLLPTRYYCKNLTQFLFLFFPSIILQWVNQRWIENSIKHQIREYKEVFTMESHTGKFSKSARGKSSETPICTVIVKEIMILYFIIIIKYWNLQYIFGVWKMWKTLWRKTILCDKRNDPCVTLVTWWNKRHHQWNQWSKY